MIRWVVQTLRAHPFVAILGGLIGLTISLSLPSCSWRQRTASGVGTALNCEQDNLLGAVAQLLPMATSAVMSAISGDGHGIDKAKLLEVAKPFKDDAFKCALATAIAVIADPIPAKSGAPAAAGLEVDGAALKATFAQVRGELGWVPVQTKGGTL